LEHNPNFKTKETPVITAQPIRIRLHNGVVEEIIDFGAEDWPVTRVWRDENGGFRCAKAFGAVAGLDEVLIQAAPKHFRDAFTLGDITPDKLRQQIPAFADESICEITVIV
jgi:hypothetical protein